ncbi:MAG: T9SS type A sorting domain-containing protein [Calditrichales bacterium]|nr:T9SS type A sorting domain-containing protein [Calditrichales bacterium]
MVRILYIIVFVIVSSLFAQEECTIGVAGGRATQDGRPLIWKTRDNSAERDNELVYNTSYSIPFLEIVNAGKTYAWMGLNNAGFAILNSLASDLPISDSGLSNGALMRNALGNCASIAEFESFLNENDHGKTRGNFAVLDSSGAAAIFEISGYEYWEFDANDSLQAERGYILRTNFAVNGNGTDGSGYERFNRTSDLMDNFYMGDTLNYKSILRCQMRDFSDYNSDPVPVPFPDKWYSYRPYGYIYTNVSINRSSSVSAAVIQSILPGESELLSTMWTMLGSPAAAITVPYWPVGPTPTTANGSSTAPLCDISLDIRSELFDYAESQYYIDSYKLLDGEGGGLWTDLYPVEDSILIAGENWLNEWRTNGVNTAEMLNIQQTYAEYAYNSLQQSYTNMMSGIPQSEAIFIQDFSLEQNYPNPFNPSTNITYRLSNAGYVSIKIYNILGREIQTLVAEHKAAGRYQISWDAAAKGGLASGIFFCRLKVQASGGVFSDFIKLNYIK